MDFISNLIKRPISLVLNDVTSPSGSSSSSSPLDNLAAKSVLSRSPTTSTPSSPALIVRKSRPNSPSCIIANAMNTSFRMSLDNLPDLPPSPPARTPISSRLLQGNNNSNSIEELLIQINETLSQAEEDSASSYYADLSSLIPKTANIKLSPLPNKNLSSSSNKLITPSPHTPNNSSNNNNCSLANNSATSSKNSSMTAAAGSAVFEINSTLNQFHIDPELEAGLLQEQLAALNNNELNNVGSKYLGLPEYDESKIPELPDNLNPNIEEQLKLSLEEAMHPLPNGNSTFNSNQSLKANAFKKLNETCDAVSSENESFAECQDNETETYRSALNSNNTTQTNIEAELQKEENSQLSDVLNLTVENVEKLTENAQQLMSTNAALQANIAAQLQEVSEAYDDIEPMDVDMSFSPEHNSISIATIEAECQLTPYPQNASLNKSHKEVSDSSAYVSDNSQPQSCGESNQLNTSDNKQQSSSPLNLSANKRSIFSIRNSNTEENPILDMNVSGNKRSTFNIQSEAATEETVKNDENTAASMNVSGNKRSTFNIQSEAVTEETVKDEEHTAGSLNVSANKRSTFSVQSETEQNTHDVFNISLNNRSNHSNEWVEDTNVSDNKRSTFAAQSDSEQNSKTEQNPMNVSGNKRSTFNIQSEAATEETVKNEENTAASMNVSANKRSTFSVQSETEQNALDVLNLSLNNRSNHSNEWVEDMNVSDNKRSTFAVQSDSEQNSKTEQNPIVDMNVSGNKRSTFNIQSEAAEETVKNDENTAVSMNMSGNKRSTFSIQSESETQQNSNEAEIEQLPKTDNVTKSNSNQLSQSFSSQNQNSQHSFDVINTSKESNVEQQTEAITSSQNKSQTMNGSVPVSSNFPTMQQPEKFSQFPHSPKTDPKKKMDYLEKSEYAEQLEATDSKNDSLNSFTNNKVLGSPAVDTNPVVLNATFEDDNVSTPTTSLNNINDRRSLNLNQTESTQMNKTTNSTQGFDLSKENKEVSLNNVSNAEQQTVQSPSKSQNKISPPASPSFPTMKSPMKFNQFPRSTESEAKKEMNFLEKSEYAERLEATPNTSINNEVFKSPAAFANKTFDNKNEDELPETPLNNSKGRRTFNINEPETSNQQRRTFNVVSSTPSTQQQHFDEPMDVDASFSTPIAKSPPLPARRTAATNMNLNPTELMPPPPAVPKDFPLQLKRPSLHQSASQKAIKNLSSEQEQPLSAKEQSQQQYANNEKDIEQFSNNALAASSCMDEMFTPIKGTEETEVDNHENDDEEFTDADFSSNSNIVLNPSDFDYLLTKGSSNNPNVDRSSLLLRFDPLLGVPVQVNQPEQQQQLLQQVLEHNNCNKTNTALSPTIEEEEIQQPPKNNISQRLSTASEGRPSLGSIKVRALEQLQELSFSKNNTQKTAVNTDNANMSVDVIQDVNIENNDTNKAIIENSHSQLDEKQNNYKMDDLEKKIRNEVLKTEDIEKKLKEAQTREEALIKRITEKDKTICRMNGVIEAYEKAIAELISEKGELIAKHEKELTELKADRDSNYHHLTSLETTFSDLHVKYEKSKEMTAQLRANEEDLTTQNRQHLENLQAQEQRYEKMKAHAIQQLEIANKKLSTHHREYTLENTKLKALLKKEEISKASLKEQYLQKTKENDELMKICDELIQQGGS